MTVETAPKAQVFSLKTPLLSSGRSDLTVARTDQLTVRLKVYAEGGENGLHTHTDEDHAFVILEGQATFYDRDDNPTVVNKHQGIMLPRGAFYRFQSTGDANLVLLRAGAGRKPEGGYRIGTKGVPLTREENRHIDGVPIPGRSFGD